MLPAQLPVPALLKSSPGVPWVNTCTGVVTLSEVGEKKLKVRVCVPLALPTFTVPKSTVPV